MKFSSQKILNYFPNNVHIVSTPTAQCQFYYFDALQFVCTGEPGDGGPDLHFTVMDRDSVRSNQQLLR